MPFPYRKSCATGKPVLKPANSDGGFSIMAIIVPTDATTMYRTELVIRRLRAEGGADCCITVGVVTINLHGQNLIGVSFTNVETMGFKGLRFGGCLCPRAQHHRISAATELHACENHPQWKQPEEDESIVAIWGEESTGSHIRPTN